MLSDIEERPNIVFFMVDQLLELIVMQDYPKTRRELFALGVH